MPGLGDSFGIRGSRRNRVLHTPLPQAASRAQPRAELELWGLRLAGIQCLGKRQALSLTFSPNPSLPAALFHCSPAPATLTCAEGSTCIMQQVWPPSAALGGFSTLFRKEQFIWKASRSLELQGSAVWAEGALRGSRSRCKAWPGLQKTMSEISFIFFFFLTESPVSSPSGSLGVLLCPRRGHRVHSQFLASPGKCSFSP